MYMQWHSIPENARGMYRQWQLQNRGRFKHDSMGIAKLGIFCNYNYISFLLIPLSCSHCSFLLVIAPKAKGKSNLEDIHYTEKEKYET